jgi:hypothetical protein
MLNCDKDACNGTCGINLICVCVIGYDTAMFVVLLNTFETLLSDAAGDGRSAP